MANWFDNSSNVESGSGGFLGGMFSNFGLDNLQSAATGLAGLYGGIQGVNTANNVNQQVQGLQGQNNSTTQAQIAALEAQIAQNRTQAQDMYTRSLADVTAQNSGLEGNIGTMTSNLNNLSDPNSSFMQMARQAIERKDAAAGRRSQWGDREVQLAGTLSEQIAKYAPGLQQSITGARNQIAQNNLGLANLYSTANNPADRNTAALIQALQEQRAGANAVNTTGRAAANSATNNQTGLINQGIGALGGLGRLFGLGGTQQGITDMWGSATGLGSGGWGNAGTNLYGSGGGGILGDGGWGFGSAGLGVGQGFTGGALDQDFLGLAGSGSLGQGLDFQSGGLGQGIQGYGDSFGGGGYGGITDWSLSNDSIW